MTRIRKQNIDMYHRIFIQGIFEWPELEVGKMLYRYFLQYGIQHLLYLGEDKVARTMLLNIPFFQALLDEWYDDVEPLKIWRYLNIDSYHHKYIDSLDLLQSNDRESVYRVACFLKNTGFLICLRIKYKFLLRSGFQLDKKNPPWLVLICCCPKQ